MFVKNIIGPSLDRMILFPESDYLTIGTQSPPSKAYMSFFFYRYLLETSLLDTCVFLLASNLTTISEIGKIAMISNSDASMLANYP